MRVNLRGLFSNVAADAKASRRSYNEHCLTEVYNRIQDVIDGKHTLAEFAEHYCMKPPPASPPLVHGVPEGYVLAPIEPTKAMCAAGFEAYRDTPSDIHGYGAMHSVYRAMLSSIPKTGEGARENHVDEG